MDDTYRELQVLLEASRDEIDSLLGRLPTLDPVELAALLESLALRDQQRAALLRAVRARASETRRREEERSIRQFVLRALGEIQAPQTAGFLEDYLYARERVVLKTRGFAALRRDENRAWRRRPGHRVAYIVPCLDQRGVPVSRWLARSDWRLAARIFVPEVDAVWRWRRVLALCEAWRAEEDAADALYVPLIARYAGEARGHEHGDAADEPSNHADVEHVEGEARQAIDRLTAALSSVLEHAATDLGRRLGDEEQLWGIVGGVPASERREMAEHADGG